MVCCHYDWPWSTSALWEDLTGWLWRYVSHMDFCEGLESYWNGRSSSVKSVCFIIITLGSGSHVVTQIWAHAFNPEVINVVPHDDSLCLTSPKTAPNKQTAQDGVYTQVCFSLSCKSAMLISVYCLLFNKTVLSVRLHQCNIICSISL